MQLDRCGIRASSSQRRSSWCQVYIAWDSPGTRRVYPQSIQCPLLCLPLCTHIPQIVPSCDPSVHADWVPFCARHQPQWCGTWRSVVWTAFCHFQHFQRVQQSLEGEREIKRRLKVASTWELKEFSCSLGNTLENQCELCLAEIQKSCLAYSGECQGCCVHIKWELSINIWYLFMFEIWHLNKK